MSSTLKTTQNVTATKSAAAKTERIHKIKKTTVRVLLFAMCVFFAILCLLPIYLLIINSTRSHLEIASSISFVPSTEFFNNIKVIVDAGVPLGTGYFNSFFVAIATTVISVYFSALTTYGFQIYNFKGKKFLYAIVLAIILIPSQLGMIGWYLLIVNLNLTNSFIPLIIPSIAAAGTVFFLRQYMQASFSEEIVQAARIDGANEIYAFHKVCLPLIIPALATMAIFTFIYTWNNYQGPLMIITESEKKTLPLVLDELNNNPYVRDRGAQTAGVFISLLPLLVMYLVFSKPIVGGVALGGVKE